MQFTFPEEQQAFADSVRRFALAKLAPDALKRAHDPRLSVRRRQADERAGAHGHQPAGGRRRPGRNADGRRHRHRAGRRRLPAQRRRGAVRQFRADPHLRRIRHGAAEGALAARPPAGPHGDEPRHHRARCRLRRHRPQDQREAGRLALHHQRQQGVLHLQPGCRDLPGLCALRARARRHRLGDRRARRAGVQHRPAVELHERRGVVRAAFRQLPHPGGERAARPRRLQEADGRLQHRAARQHRALARVRALLPSTRRASMR